MNADKSLLALLREHRKNIIHTIDPFKTRYFDGLEKVRFLGDVSPFVLVGSTDCPNFGFVSEYVADLKRASRVPIFTHFLPRPGRGYPVCLHADGLFATSVTNSSNDYFACCKPGREALRETTLNFPDAKYVNVRAITIGEDEKSTECAQTFTVTADFDPVIELLRSHREERDGCHYIFSRRRILDPALIREVREAVGHGAILFASGCIVRRDQADALLDAGADYVAVGSALETADWMAAAKQVFFAE